jgi:hypothetical protein
LELELSVVVPEFVSSNKQLRSTVAVPRVGKSKGYVEESQGGHSGSTEGLPPLWLDSVRARISIFDTSFKILHPHL